jgi:hypothetical protein
MIDNKFMDISLAQSLVWNYLNNQEQIVGGIYSNTIRTTFDDFQYYLTFTVGSGRELGILFVKVEMTSVAPTNECNYYLGQFKTNGGAMKFAEFALKNFIETETWDVVGNFEPIDYIDGVPYFLDGTEVVSDIA